MSAVDGLQAADQEWCSIPFLLLFDQRNLNQAIRQPITLYERWLAFY